MEPFSTGPTFNIETSVSPLKFETEGGGAWKVWNRYLSIEGKKAFHIGNICETCTFFFERLEGANQKVSAREVSNELREGLQSADSPVVTKLQRLLPSGNFTPVLWRCKPSLTVPGTATDYFSHEQIDLWGVDGFWGLPHNPKAEYYRSPVSRLEAKVGLFNFLIPIYPHTWLEAATVQLYQERLRKGGHPTAVSISVLDVKSPATGGDDSDYYSHYCFAHYLIDGHHKVHAASSLGVECGLLSFVALDEGISSADELHRIITGKPGKA